MHRLQCVCLGGKAALSSSDDGISCSAFFLPTVILAVSNICTHKDSVGGFLIFFHPSLSPADNQVLGFQPVTTLFPFLSLPSSFLFPLYSNLQTTSKAGQEQHAITEMSIAKGTQLSMNPLHLLGEIYSKHGPWEISLHAENF